MCEYVNAVIHALKETLMNLSPEFDRIAIKDVFIKEKMFAAYPVVVEIGFKGGIEGMVSMSMELQTAINVADLLLVTDGKYAVGFTDMVQSSLKEVANMFAGIVAMFLSEGRAEIDILPPRLGFSMKQKVSTPSCPTPVSMLLAIPGGLLEFNICLAKGEAAPKE